MHGSAGGSGTQPSASGFSSQGSVGGSGSGSPMSPDSGSGRLHRRQYLLLLLELQKQNQQGLVTHQISQQK